MTRERAKELLPYFHAWGEGKTVQRLVRDYDTFAPKWSDIVDEFEKWESGPYAGSEYRIKPSEPVKIPLVPDDVPPGSVFRRLQWEDEGGSYWMPTAVTANHVHFHVNGGVTPTWNTLMASYEILRPGQTEWQPCFKLQQPE